MDLTGVLYQTLQEDEIRLLAFLPDVSPEGLMQFSLTTVQLSKKTTPPNPALSTNPELTTCSFAALSYVWGIPKDFEKIVINSVEVSIQRNLFIALRSLHRRHRYDPQYMIWIDAICINQADVPERGKQVSKMREIYSSATEVIAWLGQEAHESWKAFDLLEHLSDYTGLTLPEAVAAKARGVGNLGQGYWLALQWLFRRPYWRRLWIMPELVMGGSRVSVRCGSFSLPWKVVMRGIVALQENWWHYKDSALTQDQLSIDQKPVPWVVYSLHLLYKELRPLCDCEEDRSAERPETGRLLVLAASTSVMDPRDRVYGLIGMMEPAIADKFHPNYDLSPVEVFIGFAQAYYETKQDLELLRECNARGTTPSWAPEWSWHSRSGNSRFQKTGSTFIRDFHASANFAASFRVLRDELRLTCQGVIADSIDGLGASRVRKLYIADSVVQPDHVETAYGGEEFLEQAISFALCAEAKWTPGVDTLSRTHILHWHASFKLGEPQFEALGWDLFAEDKGYYWQWSRWRAANKDMKIAGRPLDSFIRNAIPPDSPELSCWEARKQFNHVSDLRRFATTVKGRLGWVPDNVGYLKVNEDSVVKGDLVAVVFGCSTPIILRRVGDSYKVMGEAYFLGLMDGEVEGILKEGRTAVEEFDLV